MTYRTLLSDLAKISDAYEYEATEIVRAVAGKDRSWCLLNRDVELPEAAEDIFFRRKRGIPLQYILGEAWFFGNRFTVSEDCLIPQPDTEHLVMLALQKKPCGGKFVDLCTGSGCIAVSILKENSSAFCTAVDISGKALSIARRNAENHSIADRITFIEADVLSDPLCAVISDADIVVSNPPYIQTSVIPTLSDEVRYEPVIALDGGTDGLTFYRRFIQALPKSMKPGASLLLEIGYDQSEPVAALCADAGLTCAFHRDYGGNIRVAEINL